MNSCEDLRAELLALGSEDLRVREALLEAGELDTGYHPQMEAVHRRNAARLREIVDEQGWPGRTIAGEDGAEAAWLILQHAIGEPEMQRGFLPLLEDAAQAGEIPEWQPAYLADRICVFEGRPQIFGTQFDWNDEGVMAPCEIADPARVNERRAAVGLGPLEPPDQRFSVPPEEVQRHRRDMDEWARRAGWR